jgi:hypothetical protein
MDYSPAAKFGELRFITRHDLPMHAGSTMAEVWSDDVAEFVEQYNPMTDFIIVTGQPAAIFAIGYCLGRVGKAPRFLQWKREENCYRVMQSLNFADEVAA